MTAVTYMWETAPLALILVVLAAALIGAVIAVVTEHRP